MLTLARMIWSTFLSVFAHLTEGGGSKAIWAVWKQHMSKSSLPLIGEYSDGQPSTCSTIPTQSCAVLYDRLSAYEKVCPLNCYKNKFCPRKSLSQSISQLQLQAWVLGTCDTTGHTKASSILVFGFQVQVQRLSLSRCDFVVCFLPSTIIASSS